MTYSTKAVIAFMIAFAGLYLLYHKPPLDEYSKNDKEQSGMYK